MTYLIDANVLCEATRPQPDPRVIAWLDRHDASLHVSTLTLAEILKGINLLGHGRRRSTLATWFEEVVKSLGTRIVPFDDAAYREWGTFYAKHQKAGRLLPSFDSLIAASAIAHGHTLVTRNTGDFPADVPVINPWKS